MSTNGHQPKAIIYTRVSSGKQVEGTSLESQFETCRKKAEAIDAEVVAHYEDPGVSGGLYLARPGIQAALDDLEAGRANTLIIAKLDRYSRDREHQSAIKKRVKAAGARLVFCDMDSADTPEGDLAFGIMGTFADYERKLIKERTMKGRRRRAEQGFQPARNHSPFGYHVVSSKDVLSGAYPPDALGTYQVVEEQAKLVREPPVRKTGDKEDNAAIVTQVVTAVDEVLNAPDSCLTPAEKQGLLARVIEAIYPEDTPKSGEGLRIYLKPPLTSSHNHNVLNVQYFTTNR